MGEGSGKGTGGDGRRCIGMGGWEGNGRGWKEVHRNEGVGSERDGMEGGA